MYISEQVLRRFGGWARNNLKYNFVLKPESQVMTIMITLVVIGNTIELIKTNGVSTQSTHRIR